VPGAWARIRRAASVDLAQRSHARSNLLNGLDEQQGLFQRRNDFAHSDATSPTDLVAVENASGSGWDGMHMPDETDI
jgi:outer membrane protein TolC